MFSQQNICPYTGLRSFTEEESLYFKGRDLQVDQITALLEQNKFLMVTGASGEGKSSLIYAGLIPNARAGFFKAKYANWVVASFRPERSPVNNMAGSLASTFETKSATIETELRRGFSSLIDLYTNSDFYIDEEDDSWKQLTEPGKNERKRKAANLIVLVDQFEEFFTNQENFYNEAPSEDSQIVVNLVLETARIAIKRNLPVYVVCTMRSDYIGQCSAFRGLPEYIGFSQFFVPRLKRKDLKQVIEEPAVLSGNRISQRLIERLVYDVSEGVDQLPILQHALSQIWLAADEGNREMDLLHYAMVGGMPAHELPDEDQPAFQKWFDAMPPVEQKYFQDTGLNKVIEIHASVLYENAWQYYNKKNPDLIITQKDAKKIIALTFSCLTRIDNSRAVRNRMTLDEITSIINMPGYTADRINDVISIYREESNLFIRPFKTEDPATHKISPDTVLDITHESLIRNWDKLNKWASLEFEYYSTYLDFKKQVDRWTSSKKSGDFLLPIGPLTYFENWYGQCKPNAGWIRRYSEIQEDKVKATQDAGKVLSDIREFMKRSANKVIVTRAFMKYGPQRIATIVAIFIMLVFTGFYWFDAEQKQNARVVAKVRSDVANLMNSKEVGFDSKALPLLIEERYEPGSMLRYLSKLPAKERLSLAIETYKQLLLFDKHDQSELKSGLIDLTHVNFIELLALAKDYPFLLSELNKFTSLLSYDNYYNPSVTAENWLRELSDQGQQLALLFFRNKNLFGATVPLELNYAIQQWLTFGQVDKEKINALLFVVSPFESDEGRAMFNVYYPEGSYEINGRLPNVVNGGYHTLASLYASLGNTEKVIGCFQEIRKAGQNDYFTGSLFNNYNNILAILYQFGYREKKDSLVNWLGTHYPSNTPTTIYRNAVIRSGYLSHLYRVNIVKDALRSNKGYFFPNLCLAKREVFNALADDYDKYISAIPHASERNYLVAMNAKRRSMFLSKYFFDRGLPLDSVFVNNLLQKAIDHYRLIDKVYLDTAMVAVTLPYYSDGIRNRNLKRKQLFLYPDYMDGWFSWTYHTDLFFNFIDKQKLFEELYTTPEDLSLLHTWIAKAFEVKPFILQSTFDNDFPFSDKTLSRILELANSHPSGKGLDRNLPALILTNRAFERKDTLEGIKYYQLFQKDNFAASRDKYEYLEETFFLNQLRNLCTNLGLIGKHKEAVELAEKFEKDYEKAFAYISLAEGLYMKQTAPASFVYLDSVFSKSKEIDFSQFSFRPPLDSRYNWILLLSRIGGRDLNAMADNILGDLIEANKFNGIRSRVYGVAEEGNFFRAQAVVPSTLTEAEELTARSLIIWQACRKKESEAQQSRWRSMDRFITHDANYIYYGVF